MSFLNPRLLLILVGVLALFSFSTPTRDASRQSATPQDTLPQEGQGIQLPANLTEDPLTATDHLMMSTATASVSEWLGPLAPIAISPFFGITILAGFSQFGGDLLGSNNFISNNPVLSNPAVFWIFLGLTVVTSIPRFSKVSKPAAQAIDQLEAYAGIITIVLIRVLMSVSESDPINPQTAMVVEMGIFSFASDVLLSVAAIINIMVINTVKFCFEVMVWLIPFPFVDGMLEVANKAACAGLMAIYVWSPFVATILNLLIFVVCLFVFRWANRRVQYMRSVLCDPIWAMISKPYGLPKNPRLTVFPQSGIGPFPAKSKLLLTKTGAGWQLARASWILPPKTMELASNNVRMQMHRGMLLNSIAVSGNENNKLLFSKRYSKHLVKLSELINVPEAEEAFEVDLRSDLGTA